MANLTTLIVTGDYDSSSPKQIKDIVRDVTLTHPGLERVASFTYKVKEGYTLPAAAIRVVPNKWLGHKSYNVKGELPEHSVFWCLDELCKDIESNASLTNYSDSYRGVMLGSASMNADWENNLKYHPEGRKYTLS